MDENNNYQNYSGDQNAQGYSNIPQQGGYPQDTQQGYSQQGYQQGYQQNFQQGGYPQGYQQMPAQKSSGLSIAAMVLGIISLCSSCFGFIGIVCGLLAVILGGIALATKADGKGMAIAGLVCGIVAIIPSILVIVTAASITSYL